MRHRIEQDRNAEILRGWKAIARYLRVSIRTAQRWEATCLLPIRRQPQVTAFKTELDIWADGQAGECALD